jgi:hypothetical protein
MTNAQRMRTEVEHCADLKILRNTGVEMAQQYDDAIQTAKDTIAGWTAANERIRERIEAAVIQAAIGAGVLP